MEELTSKDSAVDRLERLESLREKMRKRRHARTPGEVRQAQLDRSKSGQLIGEPIHSELFPTAGLTDTQVDMLTEMFGDGPTPR